MHLWLLGSVQFLELNSLYLEKKSLKMSKLPKSYLSVKEVTDLLNGDDSDLEVDDDIDDSENYLDEDDLPIEFSLQSQVPPCTTRIQRESFDESEEVEQPAQTYTAKKDIQWRRREFVPNPVAYHEPAHQSSAPVSTPISYFEKYFTSELIDKFAEMTNVYAMQHDVIFKPTDSSEIRQLFGLHMYMGCNKLPRLHLYWCPKMGLEKFHRSTVIGRRRFCQLRNNLHIVNNLERPSDCKDKFYKVRPLLDSIRRRCQQLSVEQNVAVDEQMIPFKGRHSLKQYLPSKPCPWAFKNFVLCGKSGLPYDFIMYQGSSTELSTDNLNKLGFGASIILHLSQRLSKAGHNLFMDNFFTTYQGLEILKAKNINAAGTIRTNRFSKPPLLTDFEMKKKTRGHSDQVVSRDGEIVVVKWLDNRLVHVASNFVGVGTEDTVTR
jgi:hypothetical protein